MAKKRAAKMEKDMGMCGCGCAHHKWMPGISLIVAGAAYMYYGLGWALVALGVITLLGGNCKCG